MMTFDFRIQFDVDGSPEQLDLSALANAFSDVVRKSTADFMRQNPQAEFRGLTFFHPPIENKWDKPAAKPSI